MSSEPPIPGATYTAPYTEAANWFVRIQQRSLTGSEWAGFGNWYNFSRWNRLAFEQVARVWRAAPGSADAERPTGRPAPARFSWHHADAWRDAVMPLAMNGFVPLDDAGGARDRQFLPVQAAAAPAGLL